MRVLIAAGGSGGHIFPAVALANELEKDNIGFVRSGRSNGVKIIFVASRRSLDKKILEHEPYKKIFLSVNPLPYKAGFRLFLFLIKLSLDSLHALYILIGFRPDVVIGFGGYTTGGILLLAAILKIKTIIHEQNVVPGRANRFLDRFVNKVCVSFLETKKHFRNKNVVFTGNPLRKESLKECRLDAFGRLELDKSKLTILVMGGSQGARSLNDLVSKSIILLPVDKKENVQVLHIAGPREKDRIRERYDESGISGRVFEFIQNINEAYSASDLVISRSGAAAIFELAAFEKPMMLVPYPNQRNSQRLNARFFADNGAAIYIDETRLNESKLRDLIVDLIENADRRKTLSENAKKLSVINGAERLKEIILSTVAN